MMHTCSRCGFEAQPGARFCRQCGAPLFVEREETLSATRQYPSTGGSPEPGRQSSYYEDSPGTARFHPEVRPAALPLYSVPQPQGSSGAFWGLVAVVSGLAAAGILSASLLSLRVNGTRLSTRVAAHTSQLEEQIRREVELEVQQAAARASEEQARKAHQAAQAAEEAALAQQKALTAGDAPLPMEELIYPGAQVSKRLAQGTQAELASISTPDDIKLVKEFYTAKLGPAQLERTTRLVFSRTEKGVTVLVKVGPGTGSKKQQLAITITRTITGRSR